jgi:hypothetical protein
MSSKYQNYLSADFQMDYYVDNLADHVQQQNSEERTEMERLHVAYDGKLKFNNPASRVIL